MNIVTISHDPFARSDMQRRVYENTYSLAKRKVCAACDAPARFEYRIHSDGRRTSPLDVLSNWSKPVCSVGCYRTLYLY